TATLVLSLTHNEEANGPWDVDKQMLRLRLANLSLWLAKRSPLTTHLMLRQKITEGGNPQLEGFSIWDRFIPLASYREEVLGRADFEDAHANFAGLDSLGRGSLRASAMMLHRALELGRWYGVRFMLLWIGLEGLFGSSNPQEATFRLTQRAALFLGTDPENA